MISSTKNTLIKEIRSLKDKKFRDKLGVFVLEGIKPVKEAIDLNLSIREIIVTEKTFSQIPPCSYKVEVVSEQVFKSISEEVTPQGALAIVYKMPCDIEKAKGFFEFIKKGGYVFSKFISFFAKALFFFFLKEKERKRTNKRLSA